MCSFISLQYWTYHHPSYCPDDCWILGVPVWETRTGYPHRHELLRWGLAWGEYFTGTHFRMKPCGFHLIFAIETRWNKIQGTFLIQWCKQNSQIRVLILERGNCKYGLLCKLSNCVCTQQTIDDEASAYFCFYLIPPGVSCPWRGARSSWFPRLHVHRFGHNLRASGSSWGPQRLHHTNPHPHYAQWR